MLARDIVEKIRKEARKYPTQRAAVKSALRYAQEARGWIDDGVIEDVAETLALEPIQVYEIATFYDLFYTRPVGRRQLRVCTNVSCLLRGSDAVLERLRERLGVAHGETTGDGEFSLFEVECLGACGGAPAMMVGERYYENLTPESIDAVLEELGAGHG